VLFGASCLIAWAVISTAGIYLLYLLIQNTIPPLPELVQYTPPLTTRVFSQTGTSIGEFAIERRDVVPSQKVPRGLVAAFIASEDDNFFSHSGIDFVGIVRAALKNFRAGRITQGGSTITQQVAKSLIGREKTFTRKFKEAVLATRLEQKYTKEEILFFYLNQIYLGHGSYGVQAAARNYFRKNVWDLTLPEMATIAGLPQAPSDYDPVDRPKAALDRRSYVLNRMRDVDEISSQQEQEALRTPLVAQPILDRFRLRAPYFTEEVRRELQELYGTEGLYEGGLTVETSVDLDWQQAAEEALLQALRAVDRRQGFRGPLITIEDREKRAEFLKSLQERLPPEAIEKGRSVPAVVLQVDENLAEIAVGSTRGALPVFGMRWARKPDPEMVHTSVRVTDIRKVLKEGDVVLVTKADPEVLLNNEPPALRKLLPEGMPVFSLDQIPSMQGALVSIEPALGYVRSIIGGYNFQDSEFNRVLQACRQPGSAYKPLHYSLAIESKNFNPATLIVDSAVVYDDPDNEKRWKPENFDADFKGPVTVHTALVKSMNLPAIKVLDAVGINEAIAWDHKLGISTTLAPELGLALGASCVKPWDLLHAYAVFNQGGFRTTSHFIRKVTDRYGRVLLNHTSYLDPYQTWDERFDRAYDHVADTPERLISAESNYVLLSLLKAVCLYGTGAGTQTIRKPVAGKTGTTNKSADAWFVGFTHDVVTLAWIGHDDPKDPLGIAETGSHTVVPNWANYMGRILAHRPQADFEVPPGIVFAQIDPDTGYLARPDAPRSVQAAFKDGEQPTQYGRADDVARPGQFFKVDSER
jgi:penicillin-binding protein, 1A family